MRTERKAAKAAAVILAVLITMTMIPLGQQTVQAASSLKDFTSCSSYAREAVTQLNESGVIEGSQGYFYPQRAITRAELVKLIVTALDLEAAPKPNAPTFSDVPLTHWSSSFVETAFSNKIIEGATGGKFLPSKVCTREEMATMFVRALGLYERLLAAKQPYQQLPGFKDKAQVAVWADEFMEFALSNGLIAGTGNGMLSPKGMAKREQAAVITQRFLQKLQDLRQKADDLLNGNRRQFEPLYRAMTLEEDFKGDMSMKMNMKIQDRTSGEEMTTLMDMQAKINGDNLSQNLTMQSKMPDGTETLESVQSIVVDGNYYMKQGETGEWETYTAEEAGLEGLIMDPADFQSTTGEMQKEFELLQITDEGMAELNGTQVHQYTISLDPQMMSQLDSEALAGLEGMMEGFDSMKVTIFVDDQSHPVKQTFSMNGGIQQEGIDMTMAIDLDLTLSNWGTEYTITPPIQ